MTSPHSESWLASFPVFQLGLAAVLQQQWKNPACGIISSYFRIYSTYSICTHIHNYSLLSPFKHFNRFHCQKQLPRVLNESFLFLLQLLEMKLLSFIFERLWSRVDLHWHWKQTLAVTAVNILQELKHWQKKKVWTSSNKSLCHKLTAVLKKSQTSLSEACLKIHCLSEGIQSLFIPNTYSAYSHISISQLPVDRKRKIPLLINKRSKNEKGERQRHKTMQYSTVSVFCSGFSLSSQNHFPGRVR